MTRAQPSFLAHRPARAPPAGTIDRVDRNEQKDYVDRTEDQIRDSPEPDEATTTDDPACPADQA